MAIGAVVALGVPIGSLGLAELIARGITPAGVIRPLLDALGAVLWVALFLFGPIGLAIIGRSLGVRSIGGWVALAVVGFPIVAWLWFTGAVALGGALGNPF